MMSIIRTCAYGRTFFIALTLSTTIAGLVNSSFGQDKVCHPGYDGRVKYKLVQSYKGSLPPHARSLRIVVKQENFNDDYMRRMAKTIRQQFCLDEEISALIFDDVHRAKTMDEGQFLMGRIKVPEVRGFYTLTNHGKDESIEYSTNRGNPTNEVRIKLSP